MWPLPSPHRGTKRDRGRGSLPATEPWGAECCCHRRQHGPTPCHVRRPGGKSCHGHCPHYSLRCHFSRCPGCHQPHRLGATWGSPAPSGVVGTETPTEVAGGLLVPWPCWSLAGPAARHYSAGHGQPLALAMQPVCHPQGLLALDQASSVPLGRPCRAAPCQPDSLPLSA